MQPVPLFGIGNTGRSRAISAQERVNLYVETTQDAEGNNVLKLLGTPGLITFVNFGASPIRGTYSKDADTSYMVNGVTFYEVSSAGIVTARAVLVAPPVAGRVDMVDNGDQLLVLDYPNGYIYTFATHTLAQITDADFVPGETCDFMDGYFIVQRHASGQFGISALYDGMSWDALDFATAESDPDDLVRVRVNTGILNLFGSKTTEFWGASGAADFPLARIGSAAIEWGLYARYSLAKFEGGFAFLARNQFGSLQVCLLKGMTAAPISTAEVETQIATYTNAQNATGLAYMVAGHPFYQLNFTEANVSWVYDARENEWHKAQYSTAGRHRAEIQIPLGGKTYVTDYAVGKLYRLDLETYTDDGQMIVSEFVSRHQKTGALTRFASLWLEMEQGVGLQTGQGSDPQVMLQISRDGGMTWGGELWRSIGAVGKYTVRAIWNRLGQARNWTFRVRVTDPVKRIFVGAWGRYGE